MGGGILILLDTCALIFDALAPGRLSAEALRAIEEGEESGSLAGNRQLSEHAAAVKKRGFPKPQNFLGVV